MRERVNPRPDIICPRCGKPTLEPNFNALSREDNKSIVCNACGLDEAFEEYLYGSAKSTTPYYCWHYPPTTEKKEEVTPE